MRSVWPVTSTSSSLLTSLSLAITSLSIAALPSGLRTALSKSNSALAARVIFCTCGAGGGGAGGGGGGGGVTAGAGAGAGAAFGTRSGSHSTIAIAGVQYPVLQHSVSLTPGLPPYEPLRQMFAFGWP